MAATTPHDIPDQIVKDGMTIINQSAKINKAVTIFNEFEQFVWKNKLIAMGMFVNVDRMQTSRCNRGGLIMTACDVRNKIMNIKEAGVGIPDDAWAFERTPISSEPERMGQDAEMKRMIERSYRRLAPTTGLAYMEMVANNHCGQAARATSHGCVTDIKGAP